MADRSPCQLTEQENSRIYSRSIEPNLLATVQAGDHECPRLIMLGGQPGSGKTYLLRNPAEDELSQQGGFISIDADELRTYHPAAESLKQLDDRTVAMHTHPDAAAWVSRAIDTTIRERCHVVLDGTMGSPESVMERIKRFSDAGYVIEVRVLALNHRRSWLGVLRRYEDEKSRRGTGRMTPREAHDEAYGGLVKSLGQLVPLTDVRLRIFNRDHEVFDSSQHPHRSEAPQVLTAERARDWTAAEIDAYHSDVEQLVARAQSRGADADTLNAYRRLADEI